MLSSEEEDEEKHDSAKGRVRREDVWRELLKSANGRDKAFVRHLPVLPVCPVLRASHASLEASC